jgi:hypothetical protein
VSCVHCSGKNGIYIQATKHRLDHFSGSAFELNSLIFMFKADIAQYKDE